MEGWQRRRRILLGEYERIALELFAERGYHNVTVDDIAEAAGVTTRTLFRYFPSKQDCLLGFPRRGLVEELELIKALDPSDDPVMSAWHGLRGYMTSTSIDPEEMLLWRKAAEGAPDVVDRVRGERIYALNAALIDYCERSLGVAAASDPRPRLMAGIITGIELALVESATRVSAPMETIVDAAAEIIDAIPRGAGALDRRTRATRPLRA